MGWFFGSTLLCVSKVVLSVASEFGEVFTFLFFVAGLVGVLVAVTYLIGPIR